MMEQKELSAGKRQDGRHQIGNDLFHVSLMYLRSLNPCAQILWYIEAVGVLFEHRPHGNHFDVTCIQYLGHGMVYSCYI